jgi:AAA domain/MarR family
MQNARNDDDQSHQENAQPTAAADESRRAHLRQAIKDLRRPLTEQERLDALSYAAGRWENEQRRLQAGGRGSSQAVSFRLLSAAQVDSPELEPRDLVPGILAAGQVGGIFGPSKALKTSIAADLLISLASGTPFLGKFPVAKPGKVLFLAAPTGLAGLRSVARRICAARGFSLGSLSNFQLSTDLPKLDREADRTAFRELLLKERPVCVVIDPASLAMAGLRSGNGPTSLAAMGQMLVPLAELCQSTGCAVLVVHHCRRTTRVGVPITLDDVAGSGFGELSAQWLLLSRRRPFNPGRGHHELWLETGNRQGDGSFWELDVDEGLTERAAGVEPPSSPASVESLGATKTPSRATRTRAWRTVLRPVESSELSADEEFVAAREDRNLRRRALAFERQCHRAQELLADHPEGLTARWLRDMLGVSGDRINRVLDRLLGQGLVDREMSERHRGRTIWIYFWVSSAACPTGTGQFVDGKKQANSIGSVIVNPAEIHRAAEQASTDSPAAQDAQQETQEPLPPPPPSALGEEESAGRDTNFSGKNQQDPTPNGGAEAPSP